MADDLRITWPAHSHDVLITEIARLTRELEAARAEVGRLGRAAVKVILECARLRALLREINADLEAEFGGYYLSAPAETPLARIRELLAAPLEGRDA